MTASDTDTTLTWRQRAAQLRPRTQVYIDGRFLPAHDGRTFETSDPATGAVIARVARGGQHEVDDAVASARRAFASGCWSDLTPRARRETLLALADLIETHAAELALLESLDGGKLIAQTTTEDVPGTAAIFRWYAEALDKVYGEVAPTGGDDLAIVTREPLGVVGAVIPWNYPLEMAAWKLAPALAAGNSVVLKPAEETPLSALRLAELATEAGLPDGVLNVVPGFGAEAGQALGRHPDVDSLTFTGSTAVGRMFLEYAGQSNMKQVWLECGGKSANIIFDDVADLDRAIEHAAQGIFALSGQVCSANSRLLVQRSIYDRVVEGVVAHARALRVGDPLDERTEMGPLVSTQQLQRVGRHVSIGAEEATLATGGGRPNGLNGDCAEGSFLEPTVFTDVAPDATIAVEEIFGPVLAVMPFDTEQQAIEVANASEYGLAASVWTDSIHRARRVSRRLSAGTVSVNTVDALDVMVPFGGVRQSGFGRDLSLHALDKFTALKTTWFAAED
ncbi:aldehyde dehydrogenase [Pseudoclavibacter sp. 13-3]|uniref:aldehyde dehydrogenase n=1 Tax=Pseudoclavibacter sp. 13-3 TaxID=2901228 RepID=UPI001E2F450D|nr:aldehyde dehydrogenase [Pseudoclavibacter sp. 13-3]MCD7101247.1 aldehyde dehydrogenase [Pseudoclavibacter sp. 13-3]